MSVHHFSWPARYPGVCAECDEKFPVETRIRWIDPDEGLVAHLRCPEQLPSGSKEDACSECHIIHQGECW